MQPRLVFVGLGASLRHTAIPDSVTPAAQRYGQSVAAAVAQLDNAVHMLAHMPGTCLQDHSSYYQTRAWGQQRAGAYLNAAACLETHMLPSQLLSQLLDIENRLHRRRTRKRWGPRTIDLDILLYAGRSIRLPDLQIPHRWMWQRGFVLWPLTDLSAYLYPADRKKLRCALFRQGGYLLTRPLGLKPINDNLQQ